MPRPPAWPGGRATPWSCWAPVPPPDGSFPLDGTRWATERREHRGGTLPALDFAGHAAVCGFVAGLVATIVAGGHDAAAGERRARCVLGRPGRGPGRDGGGRRHRLCRRAGGRPAELFTELPSRFVVATADARRAGRPGRRASASRVPCSGRAGGDRVALGELVDLPLAALREAHEGNLERLLGDS